MHELHDPPDTGSRTRRTALIIVGIFAVALALVALIRMTEPESQQEGAVRRTAMLVEVAEVEHGTFVPEIEAMGTVRSSQEVALEPRVSGQVIRVADDFVPGRVLPEGAELLRIDPADAKDALAQARSALKRAQSELAMERGRQEVAKVERAQVTQPLTEEQEALILRTPQLRAAQAAVTSAEADLRQAELAVARTTVTAPFRALVVDRTASTGSQIGPGESVGTLLDVDRFWVELTLATRHLPFLGDTGSRVWLRDHAAWPEGTWREATLDSVVRQVDAQTRMARLLVVVDDPLGLDAQAPALLAGSFVKARIETAPLNDVIRLPLAWLRKGSTVWEMEDESLRIRQVDVVLEDARHAYIAGGLSPDAKVVTTDLSTVTEGAALRVETP